MAHECVCVCERERERIKDIAYVKYCVGMFFFNDLCNEATFCSSVHV